MRARMAMRQCVAALALLLAPLCALGAASVEVPAPNTAEEAAETLSFFATADWGGQAAAPYTTPLQLLMATAMGRASASFHPKFVLSAGGNFLPGGLAGTGVSDENDQIRVGATFDTVFSPSSLQVPWYIAGGTPDWEGNLTAEMSFNGSSFTSGRWIYPARYHTFTTSVPGGGDTVQVIMLDTEALIGGMNKMPTLDMPPLYYPPPAARRASRRLMQTVPLVPTAVPTPAFTAAAGATAAPLSVAASAAATAGAVPLVAPTVPAYTLPAAGAAGVPPLFPGVVPGAAAGAVPGVDPWAPGGGAAGVAGAAGAAGSAGAADGYGTQVTFNAASLAPSMQLSAQAALTAAADDFTFTPPPVDEAQWNWLEGQLNSSSADWLIVVGYHPVWSAGAWGPTWPLVERLIPMMQTAGVSLYISGNDHLMQHFNPVPIWTNVDYIVVGNGAYAMPAGTTAAEAMPHALDCPDNGLQFSFGETSGFAALQVTTASSKQPSELHVNFFDANQTMIYSFFKENPRTMPGHIAGDLRSPPAPGRGPSAAATYNSQPLMILAGAFLVVAVLLCLIGAASHARRQMMYFSALRGSRSRADPGIQVATAEPDAGESTPLMLGQRAYAPPAARPMARKYVA